MDVMEFVPMLIRHMTANKSTLYVFCPFNIGDFLINGGLCHALLKKKRKQTCILIVRDRFANCGLNFVGVKEVQYISSTLMYLIRQYIYATGEYETDNYVYGHFQMKANREDWSIGLIWNENLSFVNRYKENVFGLPLDTELIPPIIEPPTDFQKQRLHSDYVLDKKRTIILTPYANSTKNLEENFWEKLASELIGKGYVLYTNVADPQEKVMAGTAPMVTTFNELIYLAEKVNCFIGLRSGIFDLLAFTNARLLYIINGPNWHDDLELNYNHLNSRAFYTLNAQDREILRAFLQQNNISSINDLIFNNKVSGKDISLSCEHLLEKILSAVEQEGT